VSAPPVAGRSARIERGPQAGRALSLPLTDLGFLLGLFAASHGAILAVAALTGAFSDPPEGVVAALVRWDARWYVEIATVGYHREAGAWESGDGVNWPFFPALPALIEGAIRLTGLDGPAAGLAVAGALRLLGLLALFLWTRDLFGRRVARLAAALWAVWPFAVHGAVPLSEALFAPLLMLTLWRARRGAWLGAGVGAALLSATRAPGAFVAFPLLWLAARRHGLLAVLTARPGTERAVLMLAACGLGIGGFILWLDTATGDGLAFQRAQVAWGREPKWPWMTVWDALNPITRPPETLAYNAVNLTVAAAALALAAGLLRLRLGAEALHVAIIVLLGLAAGQTTSLPRFVGALPPLVLPLAVAMARRRGLRAPLLGGSALLMLAATALWGAETMWMM
jgi:hypothetical protein